MPQMFPRNRMATISVINRSTVVSPKEVTAAVAAVQVQVSHDFAPQWGIDAELKVVDDLAHSDPTSWIVAILDNTDQDGALGYHDVLQNGTPLTQVFAKTDLKYGLNWTVTLSHEVLEMLGDPNINLVVAHEGRLYSYENCDAVEDDSMGYPINGVVVSNFMYPSWFQSFWQPGQVQFDHRGVCKKPFEIAAGGYMPIFDLTTGRWKDISSGPASARLQAKKEKIGRTSIRKTKSLHDLRFRRNLSKIAQSSGSGGSQCRVQ